MLATSTIGKPGREIDTDGLTHVISTYRTQDQTCESNHRYLHHCLLGLLLLCLLPRLGLSHSTTTAELWAGKNLFGSIAARKACSHTVYSFRAKPATAQQHGQSVAASGFFNAPFLLSRQWNELNWKLQNLIQAHPLSDLE